VSLFTRAAGRVALSHIGHVTPVGPASATGLVGQVYRQVERDFGMLAPPVALHSPAPATLAAAWMMLRETLLVTGTVPRATKEAVAAAVSAANACPYCVEIHGATLTGLGGGPGAAAIAAGRTAEIADPQLRAVAGWAGDPVLRAAAPFPAAQLPELGGVAVVFHYINRMVSVFLRPSPLPPLPAARRGSLWVASRMMGAFARREASPGASLDLLPPAPMPPDLAWAGQTRIADAFARAGAAVEEAAVSVVPERIRYLVLTRLSAWDGTPPGASAAWTDAVLAGVPEDELAVGRLALLTAQSAYQVGDRVIGGFRERDPRDASLVTAVSWAALTAARCIGARLPDGATAA
jgi:AhpD family alkylhydroperoxidase